MTAGSSVFGSINARDFEGLSSVASVQQEQRFCTAMVPAL